MCKYIIYLSLVFLLISCGGVEKPAGVTPNFIGNGFAVFVEQTALNTYKFTVTSNEDHKGAIFTVYGLADESQVGTFNTAARMRLDHISDAHDAGDTFEVTFNSDDNFFIIYEDALLGGTFVYNTVKEMVRGQFR